MCFQHILTPHSKFSPKQNDDCDSHHTMEQSIGDWSEKEMQVAQILVDLNHVWVDRASSFTWGRKRKRSGTGIEDAPCLSSPQSTPSRHAAVVKPKSVVAIAIAAAFKPQSNAPGSPASPLSLSHTESDEKLKTKSSLATKREGYLRIIQDLTKTKESLNQEIDNVKRHCAQLKDFNLRLRARQQKLSNNGSEESESEDLNLANGVNSSDEQEEEKNRTPRCEPSTLANQNQKCGPTSSEALNGRGAPPSISSSSSMGRVNAVEGPLQQQQRPIPDLNLTVVQVDSCQPLDKSRANEDSSSKDKAMAMAAQARQRRLQICRLKMKKHNGTSKSRFSYYR